MPRTCTVCRHSHREEIEIALMASEPLRAISRKNCISTTALFRHKAAHLAPALKSVLASGEELRAGTLLDRLRELNVATWAILQECRATGRHHTALSAIGRIERQIELEAKLQPGNAAHTIAAADDEPNFDNVDTETLTKARDLMEQARLMIEAPVAEMAAETVGEVEGSEAGGENERRGEDPE